MRQHRHVVALAPTGRAILRGEIVAPADAEYPAEAVDRRILSRPINELEPHRFPSQAKKRSPASVCRAPADGSHSLAEGASTRRPYLPAAPLQQTIPAAADPAHQRRQPDAQILGYFPLRPSAGRHQTYRLVVKLLREPSLLRHRGHLHLKETLHFSGASPIGYLQAAELRLPCVVGRARHTVPAAKLRDHCPHLGLLQNADLLFRKLLPPDSVEKGCLAVVLMV
jgi:hypothetical protein